MIRAILRQVVDIAMLLINIGLLVWYIIDYPNREFTAMLLLDAGYIIFNIINKAILNTKYIITKRHD